MTTVRVDRRRGSGNNLTRVEVQFRRFSRHLLTVLTLLCACLPSSAFAQDNPLPQGRMTFLIGFTPGGPLDVVSRLVAEKLGTRIDRTIVLENRPGAGGNVAAAAVAKSEPNGLTC